MIDKQLWPLLINANGVVCGFVLNPQRGVSPVSVLACLHIIWSFHAILVLHQVYTCTVCDIIAPSSSVCVASAVMVVDAVRNWLFNVEYLRVSCRTRYTSTSRYLVVA